MTMMKKEDESLGINIVSSRVTQDGGLDHMREQLLHSIHLHVWLKD